MLYQLPGEIIRFFGTKAAHRDDFHSRGDIYEATKHIVPGEYFSLYLQEMVELLLSKNFLSFSFFRLNFFVHDEAFAAFDENYIYKPIIEITVCIYLAFSE